MARRTGDPGTRERLRLVALLTAAQLPRHDLQRVEHRREEVRFERPVGVVAVQRVRGRRVGRQRVDERGDSARRQGAAPQVEEVDAGVETKEVGLDRLAVVG